MLDLIVAFGEKMLSVAIKTWQQDGWWLLLGLGAQAMFFSRFVVQWIVSEKAKRSTIPVAFWWISIGGGLSLFIYALHREEGVFAFGQLAGLLVYIRNLFLIRGERRAGAAQQ